MNLFMDGFDHYAAADAQTKGWSTTFVSVATGRFGGQCVTRVNLAGCKVALKQTSSDTIFIGQAISFPATATYDLFNLYDTGTVQVTVRYDTSAQVFKIYRGGLQGNGTLIATSGVIPYNMATWYFFETKVVIHDTTGSVTIRVNGTQVYTVASLDTKESANAYATHIAISNSSGTDISIDDLFVNDNSGSLNNDYIGEQRIKTLYPTGAGAHTQFTPSTSTNVSCVDETLVNTTDYNSDATVNDIDTFTFGDVTSTDVVAALQVCVTAQKDDANAKELAPLIRQSATDYAGTGVALSSSWVTQKQIYETDPATAAAWTVANVNAAEFGYKVAA